MESLSQTNINPKYIFYAGVVIVLIGIILVFSLVYSKRRSMSTTANIARINSVQTQSFDTSLSPFYKPRLSLYNFMKGSPSLKDVAPLQEDEKILINFAPLTITQPGFIGPLIDGVYNEKEGVANAIRAGARCFILPIDYHEDSTLPRPQFAPAGQPCLLMRDAGGTIRSLNSGSIQKIAETLSSMAFSDTTFTQNDPLMIVLYFVRTPDVNEDPKAYLRFCSKVAKELGPLLPNLLGQTPEGSYNRQAKQDSLFFSNLSQFEKKVIILSNLDTTMFRTPEKAGLPAFNPKEDLDFLVHVRIYKDSTQEFGATSQLSDNQMPRAIVNSLGFYKTIPKERAKSVIDTTKIRWTLALPLPPSVADVESIKSVADNYGVHSIPLSLYENPNEALKLWSETAWRPKPKAVRFTNPKPFTPEKPSGKVNANQGQISSPG